MDEAPPPATGASPGNPPVSGVIPPQGAPPGTTPTPAPPAPPADPDLFTFNGFSEPVELTLLVDFVRDQLGLPILATDNNLSGQKVVLPVAIKLKKDKVLTFLTALLETKGYTIVRSESGVFFITPIAEIVPSVGDSALNTTRIIQTRGLRPSSFASLLGTLGFQPSQSVATKGQTAVAYLDDIGVIVVTGSPRQTGQVAQMVDQIVEQEASIRPQRYPLRNVAGSYARERVLELMGSSRGPRQPGQGNPNQGGAVVVPGGQTSFQPLEERLSVDPQGNALYFRGRPTEVERLESLLAIVDVPNSLQSKWYALGSAARAIATEGQKQGLGDITIDEGSGSGSDSQQAAVRAQLQAQQQQFGANSGSSGQAGPGFTIYQDKGGFMYRGTPEQHDRVARLVEMLADVTAQDLVVYEFYKLKHSKAMDVAELIHNLLTNQVPTGGSALVQGGPGNQRRTDNRTNQPNRSPNEPATPEPGAAAGGSLVAITGDQDTFVLGDEANNQVVVKAPKKMQAQFARLIDKLDLRRPQVYVDVKIVAITATDNFRLAFETQLLSGDVAFNTNFGLSTFPENGSIDSKKSVIDTLLGATAAYIRSDQVPIIITALQQNVNTRILSSPQLLVDDNEEAKVDSVDKQPYTTTSVTAGNPQTTSFGGDAEAGTKLRIKPQISEGDYLKLDYEVELSSFTGQSADPGVPPPSQVNKINAKSVTVPSDTTIVVGGLQFEQSSETVFKVPLLGDIPIIGQLFRDQRKDGRKGTLYVFITPRIMKEPSFADLRLLTRRPMRDVELPQELPPPEPVRIDIVEPGKTPPPAKVPQAAAPPA